MKDFRDQLKDKKSEIIMIKSLPYLLIAGLILIEIFKK